MVPINNRHVHGNYTFISLMLMCNFMLRAVILKSVKMVKRDGSERVKKKKSYTAGINHVYNLPTAVVMWWDTSLPE